MSYPSVWLTSYCARVFQEANFYEWENLIFIDPQVKYLAIGGTDHDYWLNFIFLL